MGMYDAMMKHVHDRAKKLEANAGLMTWTTDEPTKPGWYWFKDIGPNGLVRSIDIVQVFWEEPWGKNKEYGGYWAYAWGDAPDEHERVEVLNGEWAGPIEPPTEREEG